MVKIMRNGQNHGGNTSLASALGRRGKHLLLALLLVLVIICISIALVVTFRPVYYFDVEYLDIPESSGIPAEICRENYDALIEYNLLGGPDRLDFPDFAMSEQGRIHFAEVKRIFAAAQIIALVGCAAFAGRLLYQRRRGDRDYLWLRLSCWVALAIVAAAGGLVAASWKTAFVLMHKILFRNDFWILDADTDPIILILPAAFFMHCGILIMVLVVLLVIGCRLLGRWLEESR